MSMLRVSGDSHFGPGERDVPTVSAQVASIALLLVGSAFVQAWSLAEGVTYQGVEDVVEPDG